MKGPKISATGVQFNRQLIQHLPAKCKMYLNLLISVREEKSYSLIPKAVRKKYENFTSIFKNLDEHERTYFITKNIEYTRQRLNRNIFVSPSTICEIQTTCEVKTSFMKMTFWEKRTLKYEYKYQRIKLSNSKKQQFIDLKSYLVRTSHSEKNTLVLESFDPVLSQKFQKISIKLSNSSICGEILSNLREVIIEISFKRVECLLGDDLNEEKDIKAAEEKQSMDLTILTTKNISEFFEKKEQLLSKLKKGRRDVFGIYSGNDLTINNSSQSSKCYYLEYTLPKQWSDMKIINENLKILGEGSISRVFTCQKLERFSASISANYYKIYTQDEEFELIMIVERNDKEDYIHQIMKSTSNIFFGINVPFMEIIISKPKDKHYTLQINAIVKKNQQKKSAQNQRTIIKFLSNLAKPKYIFKAPINNIECGILFSATKNNELSVEKRVTPRSKSLNRSFLTNNNDFNTQSPQKSINLHVPYERNTSQEEDKEVFYSIEDIQQLQENEEIQQIYHAISSKIVADFKQQAHINQEVFLHHEMNSYLKVRCINQPLEKQSLKLIVDHVLLMDWKKSSKGGVVCINKAAIQEQKRVVKLAFNQIGSKVFKMKGIINFSLPIQICRGESALVSLARNISYAPLLLQNSKSMAALERMKKMILLQISWCSLALSTQKPFNPILGETYQGLLDGCPIFMQQISHHPAISYLYLIGRGYKIYGQIAPNICLRLNYFNAISQDFITIQFDNGDKCWFSIASMVINGLIFGERSIYFDGTQYVVDKTNNLIAQIRFNGKNNGIFKLRQNPDSLVGEIYQVSSAFMNKFIAAKKRLSPKKDENSHILQNISGQWNGTIMFNSQKVFDLETDLPVLLENSQTPLASDGFYRQDVILRKAGDNLKGQVQKERLEEMQRDDKKLRSRYKEMNQKK